MKEIRLKSQEELGRSGLIMHRADFYIFGYRRLTVDKNCLPKATTLLLKNQIMASIDGVIITIRERDFSKIRGIFNGRIDFSYSEPLGMLGGWRRMKHKGTFCLSLIFSLLLLLLSTQLIWDIRVVENEMIADSEVVYRLSECGFSIGDLWAKADLSSIENSFLSTYDDVGWININRRGNVAYVSLIEKLPDVDTGDEGFSYSNIVSSRDSVIEEITVKSGSSAVKVGDAVKKGDLLILGASSEASGGYFCRAEGQIIGRISDSLTVKVDRFYEKKQIISKRICAIKINIFKISINIFEMYGNLTNNYDIIEDEKEYSLPGGKKLPFSISLTYQPIYKIQQLEYTDEEIVSVASDRLNVEIALMLSQADLIKISTHGEFTDDGYVMSSDVVYLAEIGSEKSFEITE